MRYTNKRQKKNAIWWGASLALLVFLSLYIFQVQQMTSSAYTLSRLETAREDQKEANKNLRILHPAGNSFENLVQLARYHNFEKVRDISYVQLLEGPVARSALFNE
jgi:D-alanyl-lipoteichoic acid acyltransferase DltB (MBOAT superfamily)